MTTATKATHTPGPWRIDRGSSITATWDNGEEVQLCCMNTTTFCGGTEESSRLNRRMHEETTANIRLIAACPEMLEALELLVKQGAFPTEAYEKALAVIRKVRGGE